MESARNPISESDSDINKEESDSEAEGIFWFYVHGISQLFLFTLLFFLHSYMIYALHNKPKIILNWNPANQKYTSLFLNRHSG